MKYKQSSVLEDNEILENVTLAQLTKQLNGKISKSYLSLLKRGKRVCSAEKYEWIKEAKKVLTNS